ncbi:hypothetical protein PFISCL1PPCAC_11402 [Pristionchus fissidentatus]|uniref:Uncharacterized protein n=1 Tax=Pristionchus fissidentatus TaxID=1538716 RepID=A0AAV5VKC7_9BILA|nr:hypothetical protein PFISCL1PPCAC_11402 [Pristionchus fissidentatus]
MEKKEGKTSIISQSGCVFQILNGLIPLVAARGNVDEFEKVVKQFDNLSLSAEEEFMRDYIAADSLLQMYRENKIKNSKCLEQAEKRAIKATKILDANRIPFKNSWKGSNRIEQRAGLLAKTQAEIFGFLNNKEKALDNLQKAQNLLILPDKKYQLTFAWSDKEEVARRLVRSTRSEECKIDALYQLAEALFEKESMDDVDETLREINRKLKKRPDDDKTTLKDMVILDKFEFRIRKVTRSFQLTKCVR